MYILYKVISLLLIRKDETLILVIYLTLNSRGWRMKYVRARYIIMNVFVLIHYGQNKKLSARKKTPCLWFKDR